MEQQEETQAVESARRIKSAVLNISDDYVMTDPQGRKVTVVLELTTQRKDLTLQRVSMGGEASSLALPGTLEK